MKTQQVDSAKSRSFYVNALRVGHQGHNYVLEFFILPLTLVGTGHWFVQAQGDAGETDISGSYSPSKSGLTRTTLHHFTRYQAPSSNFNFFLLQNVPEQGQNSEVREI